MRLLILFFLIIFVIPISFSQESYCDYKIEILLNGSVFDAENFTWRMRATKIEGLAANITGTAQIEDLEENLIKSYKPWTNDSISRQKTSGQYSPNLKPNEYRIKAEIGVSCNDVDRNNNVDARLFKIESANQQSIMSQDTVANNIDNPADENIEKQPFVDKNTDTQQIQGQQNETKIKQSQEQNQDKDEDNIIHLKMQPIHEKNNTLTAAVAEPKIVYESSIEKSRDLILYFLLVLSILLNIILIWRR